MNLNLILLGLLVVAAFLIGSLYTKVQVLEKGGAGKTKTTTATTGDSAPQAPPPEEKARQKPNISADSHLKGDRNAQIALVEYSDLECPFCKRFHPTAQQAVDEYKGKLMWVYKHFPLDQIHSKADKEAEATECAAELGGEEGFWQMTDKIFEVTPSNNGLNLDDLPKLAAQVGLNQTKFKDCLDSGKMAQRVEADYQEGVGVGISGTPGNVLVNIKTGETKLIPGAVPYETLKQAIDEMLKG